MIDLPSHMSNLTNLARQMGVNERLSELEKKVSKKVRKTISTRAQQMLLLQQMGFFENPYFKSIASTKRKAKLLAVLLNASSDNIEGDLSSMNLKNSPLKTVKNYELLIHTFEQAGLKDLAELADRELNSIINEKDKKKLKK